MAVRGQVIVILAFDWLTFTEVISVVVTVETVRHTILYTVSLITHKLKYKIVTSQWLSVGTHRNKLNENMGVYFAVII